MGHIVGKDIICRAVQMSDKMRIDEMASVSSLKECGGIMNTHISLKMEKFFFSISVVGARWTGYARCMKALEVAL